MIHGSLCSIPVTLYQSATEVPKVVLGVSLVASNHHSTVSSNKHAHVDIKQVHSTDRMTSATVGHSPHRSVMCTHLKHCHGSRCMCSEICSFFLADSCSSLSDFVLKHVPVMKDKLSYPYLIVLAQEGEMVKVSCNDGNILTQSLLPGSYDFRDSFMWPSVTNPHLPQATSVSALHSTQEVQAMFTSPPRTTSTASSTTSVVLEPLLRDWAQVLDLPSCMTNMQLCGREQACHMDENSTEYQLNSQPCKKRALSGVTGVLQSATGGKLARVNANSTGGLTVSNAVATALRDAHCTKYLNSGTAEGLTLLRHRHTRELHSTALTPAVHRAVAIKKPVNAYNFFSMDERARMRDGTSCPDEEDERSNNEWNREVGRRWTAMTPLMRHPYELRAVQDSLRYTQECEQHGLSEDARRKGVTAYNLFVAQERCFTTGLNIADLKKRNGQHCSFRWSTMRREEKRLYEQLAQYENRKRNRQ